MIIQYGFIVNKMKTLKSIIEEGENGNKPNPGSEEAIKQGCICPVIDNHYGEGLPNGDFWYTEGCPVHTNNEK